MPVAAALEKVAESLESKHVLDEFDADILQGIHSSVDHARLITKATHQSLTPRSNKTPWETAQAHANFDLAQRCLELMLDVWEKGHDNVDADSRFAAAAELTSNSLAALVLGLIHVPDPCNFVEAISAQLDDTAPFLYATLSRMDSKDHLFSGSTSRLHRGLQGICAWTVAGVFTVVGHQRFTSKLLWELASEDAVWTVILAKGVLSMSPCLEAAVIAPPNLHVLQNAVYFAIVGLASPDVVFSAGDRVLGFELGDLSFHRTGVASAFLRCSFLATLLVATNSVGDPVVNGKKLASFLAALLDFYADTTSSLADLAELSVRENLAQQLKDYAELLWYVFGQVLEVSADAAESNVPPSFFADCAVIAGSVPVPTMGALPCLQRFLELALCQNACLPAAGKTLSDLIFITACSGMAPGHPQVRALDAALSSVESKDRSDLVRRCHCRACRLPEPSWPTLQAQLQPWADFLVPKSSAIVEGAIVEGAASAAACPAVNDTKPAAASRRAFLTDLLEAAPKEYCCKLDGRLLLDPVLTPVGLICERSEIVRALASSDGLPVCGVLDVDVDCQRLPELRRAILAWVRSQRKPAAMVGGKLSTSKASPHE